MLLFVVPFCVLVASLLIQRAADRADATLPPASSTDAAQDVEAYLTAQRDALGIPGMAMALVRDDQADRLWADGVARPGVPMTPDTPVLLASVSKSLTAIAVMRLVDTGELALDEPVVSYLPWFTTSEPALSDTITVAHLLHHSSGLADGVTTDGDLLDDQDPGALERGVRMLADVDLQFAPGSGFDYSNLNYNVLGLLVQTVSGQQFADYMRDHVFAPIGMDHATADPADAADLGAAEGYYRWFSTRYLPTAVPLPGRSAPSAISYASASDLARELRLNLDSGTIDGTAVLSAAATEQLHRPVSQADSFNGYAMGWFVRPLWEQADPGRYKGTSTQMPLVWEHSGTWPTTATYIGFSPALGIGFALVMNGNDRAASSRQYALATNVWRLLLDNPTQPLGEPSEDFLTHYGAVVALTGFAVLLAVLVQTAIEVRHRRDITRRRRLTVLGLALALDLSLLAFIWLYLPSEFEAPVNAIIRFTPDIGPLLLATTAIVVLWGVPRTLLLALDPDRRTTTHAPDRPGMTPPEEPPSRPVASP